MATKRKKIFKKIGLVAKTHGSGASAVVRRLARWIDSRRAQTCILEEHTARFISSKKPGVSREDLVRRADLVVVIGGDGTLLSMARVAAGRRTFLLGINLGSLGFLTAVPLSQQRRRLDAVFNGHYTIDRRMMLTARLSRRGRRLQELSLLNDIVINKSALARIIDLKIRVDGQAITTYKADGLILSTPTGSTAYSMSAGGPIVYPNLQAIVITPICPHTLTNRPLVLPETSRVEVRLETPNEDVYLTLDGQVGIPLHGGDVLTVRRTPGWLHLVQPEGSSGFFEVLRRKLKWGGDR